ncbi:MAG: hypothetical protein RSB10_00775 [Clostridia bacterium]
MQLNKIASRKYLIAFVALVILMTSLFVACVQFESQLSAPVLSFDEQTNLLSWQEVPNAKSYKILLHTNDDTNSDVKVSYVTGKTSHSLSDNVGKYAVEVFAVGGGSFSSSAKSAIVVDVKKVDPTKIQLSTPTLTFNKKSKELSWQAVDNASNYKILIHSGENLDSDVLRSEVLTKTTYSLTAYIGRFAVEVTAQGYGEFVSSKTALIVVEIEQTPVTPPDPTKKQLDTPILQFDATTKMLSWQAVSNVSNYKIVVHADANFNSTVILTDILERNSYSLESFVGKLAVEVTAQSYGEFVNSEVAKLVVDAPDAPTIATKNNADMQRLIDGYHINYVAGSNVNLQLRYAQELAITNIELDYPRGYITIDQTNCVIDINANYFKTFNVGAKLLIQATCATGEKFKTYISIVSQAPLVITPNDGNSITYMEGASDFKFCANYSSSSDIFSVAIDGEKVDKGWLAFSASGNIVTVKRNEVLDILQGGEHRLQVFARNGIAEAKLFVSSNFPPSSLVFDFDSDYPNQYLRWQTKKHFTSYKVIIDGAEYTSEKYPEKFGDKSFNLAGLSIYNNTQMQVIGREKTTSSVSQTLAVKLPTDTQKQYLDKKNKGFELFGEKYNRYISSLDDLNTLCEYFVLRYDEMDESQDVAHAKWKEMTVMFDLPSSYSSLPALKNEIIKCFNTMREAIKNEIYLEEYQNADGSKCVKIYLKIYSTVFPTVPGDYVANGWHEFGGNDTRYSTNKRAVDFNNFAVDKIARTAQVKSSVELYMALERGLRPIPMTGSNAESVYRSARNVLRTIVDDSMNDFQKVRAIYDWVADNIVYDHNSVNSMGSISPSSPEYDKFYGYDCFFAEGVFLGLTVTQNNAKAQGLAVCNGIAGAISIMCNIEGILCYKVDGKARQGGQYFAHAWNKMFVDGNWYMCDNTWGNARFGSNGSQEALSHNWFMVTSGVAEKDEQHVENKGCPTYNSYAADTQYDPMANAFFVNKDSEIIDCVVTDEQKLKKIVDCVIDQKFGVPTTQKEYLVSVRMTTEQWKSYSSVLQRFGYSFTFYSSNSGGNVGIISIKKTF